MLASSGAAEAYKRNNQIFYGSKTTKQHALPLDTKTEIEGNMVTNYMSFVFTLEGIPQNNEDAVHVWDVVHGPCHDRD